MEHRVQNSQHIKPTVVLIEKCQVKIEWFVKDRRDWKMGTMSDYCCILERENREFRKVYIDTIVQTEPRCMSKSHAFLSSILTS